MMSIQKVKTGIWLIVLFLSGNILNAQDLAEAKDAYNEGVELVNQNKLEEALEKFTSCVEICDMVEDEEAYQIKEDTKGIVPNLQFKIAGKYLQESDYENGIVALEKTIDIADEYSDNITKGKAEAQLTKVYVAYGKNQLKSKNFEGANQYLDKALEVDPDNASVYVLKGYMYKMQGMDPEVKSSFMKAVEVAQATNDRRTEKQAVDQGWKYFYKKATNALSSQDFNTCIENTSIALEFEPTQVDVMMLLLQSYNKVEKYDEAIETGSKALQIVTGEKLAGVKYELALANQAKGNNDEACTYFKEALVGPYQQNAQYQIEHILKCDE